MIIFFKTREADIIAAGTVSELSAEDIRKLCWLFGEAQPAGSETIEGLFTGPRKEMVTPWSTNAVEITQNMGIAGISRIEEFRLAGNGHHHDPMLQALYSGLDQNLFSTDRRPEPLKYIDDIAAYNKQEGLALSSAEIEYLEGLARSTGRHLTDSEVFGFSQVNSEHCRHKIFNGTFIIDGEEQESSLFQMIKKTTRLNPNKVVSAYKDNCAFLGGPVIEQFAPGRQDEPDYFAITGVESVLSLKAETHNFPTTVEPFNGAATGTGGEIRDRIAGGKGAFPIAGTAVYMTSYPRTSGQRPWEQATEARKWLYQTPGDILIKASNGASDFGNKFGQPLICGSVYTFEHFENNRKYGFDKVIMLAGGIGTGKKKDSEKDRPEKGDLIVMLGGDNYRIGMGGGAVSSVDTGKFSSSIELNAVQRANPEMQKRVYNALRALAESEENPVVSIHDHGAGGHLNCLSELVESTGGRIDISKLPVGDPTLSAREIIGNESQERMGLIIRKKDVETLRRIADRERAPMYIIGEVTGDMQFTLENPVTGEKPIDIALESLFGNPPGTVINDSSVGVVFRNPVYKESELHSYVEQVLQIEEVACKDWLTNKVDRSVTGRLAKQQCAGPLQLPLNNLGAIALDYRGISGMATSIGHAPSAALADPAAGSVLSIAEALTNIIWAPLPEKLRSVSLSANWMWPCKNEGEDARLYRAVKAASDFAIALGINIPTGKDSLSMTQKYEDDVVYAPGTVIISAAAEVSDIRKIVEPVVLNDPDTAIVYIDMSSDALKTGGSSFAQILNAVGNEVPTVNDPAYFARVFNTVQELITGGEILAGHDISAGGLITCLLEMCFSNTGGGMKISLDSFSTDDIVTILFSQNPGLVIQVRDEAALAKRLEENNIAYISLGHPVKESKLFVRKRNKETEFDIVEMRKLWFTTSWLLDIKQSGEQKAGERFRNYTGHQLRFDL
ncbi:MAG: phosphoribosylformylglycinamidine synthase, partial [Bacteroidales bacterium]|nr:phosphoribosylformylglycinamidine synthase [Bacteroidales bacterium]